MKTLKYLMLVCCVAFASQAWSQTTRSLTVTAEPSGYYLKFTTAIEVYKGNTLVERATIMQRDDMREVFNRVYTDANYPTRVNIRVQLPGMDVYFNGVLFFSSSNHYVDFNQDFYLTTGNNVIDIYSH